MKKKITIIEDDPAINRGIELILGTETYEFVHAYSFSQVENIRDTDLIILDINLPDGNGLDFLMEFRKTSDIPVLILTANDTEMDQVAGLELGADDYVTKPFSLMVLRLRVQKLLQKRRENTVYEEDSLFIDFENFLFRKGNQELELSKTEIRLLKYFLENPGVTLSRDKIIDYVWQTQSYVDENALSVSIKRLRDKIEDKEHKYVHTVYGIGYVWKWGKDNVSQKK